MKHVSIILPCFNEEKTIGSVLQAIATQTYPRALIEVVVVDGKSTDGTLSAIQAFRAAAPDVNVRVICNERRIIPTALNLGIAQAAGEFILRIDGHSVPCPGYVERCVDLLSRGVAENVGGKCIFATHSNALIAEAITRAVSHPFGIGNAAYRYSNRAAYVDTAPFGAFRRELFSTIGGYDESLLSNEDYELNYRVRKAGGRVYLSPDISCTYYVRDSLHQLGRQYWRYGWWKARMLLRHPAALRIRQCVAPAFLAMTALLFIAGFASATALELGLGLICVYFGAALVAAVHAGLMRPLRLRAGLLLPMVFAVIHGAWGLGFWASLAGAACARRGFLNTQGGRIQHET